MLVGGGVLSERSPQRGARRLGFGRQFRPGVGLKPHAKLPSPAQGGDEGGDACTFAPPLIPK